MHIPISIIGAGIGGLTTALVLQQKGLFPVLFETAPAIKPVGAGIMMAINAMRIYEGLGVREKIERAGHRISRIRITDEKLNLLSGAELSAAERKYGVCNVAIHRGDLQSILADAIGYDHIRLSKKLHSIEGDAPFGLQFEDGTLCKTDVLIGADGIRSMVRSQLLNTGRIRNTGQVCWRGVCEMELPEQYHHVAHEAWGKGKRFGFVKISDRKVYWFAVANEKLLPSSHIDLPELFSDFHKDMLHILSNTPPSSIIRNDIIDLEPIYTWQGPGFCLIGDAAHATTPNMGQGACQAVEDAWMLGELLSKKMLL